MVVISARTEEGFKKLVKSQAAEDFNEETLEAFKEAEEGSLTECKNLVELHKALGI